MALLLLEKPCNTDKQVKSGILRGTEACPSSSRTDIPLAGPYIGTKVDSRSKLTVVVLI